MNPLYLSIIYKKKTNKQNELLRSLLEPQWPGAVEETSTYRTKGVLLYTQAIGQPLYYYQFMIGSHHN